MSETVVTPRKRPSKGVLWGVFGGAAVILVAAAVAIPALLSGPSITASDVVEGYLSEIAEGDAEGAKSHVDTYADEGLLTDEVLRASLELGAIEDIAVGEPTGDGHTATVPATFMIGGERISRDFQVFDSGDGGWKILDGLISVAGLTGFDGLGLTVNGVDSSEPGLVFPGTYEFALGVEQFAIAGGSTTVVLAADADAGPLSELTPALTDDGAASYRALVRAAVEGCVAMKTLATPCGMDLTEIDLAGATPVEGTVTRTITPEGQAALDGLPAERTTGATVTTVDMAGVSVGMTLDGEQDGETAAYEVSRGGYLDSPTVDFAAETPAVVWD